MGNKSGNTFSKALKHLKSTQIDEKISMLNEMHTNMFNRLDPISANSMPPTGNPEIDAKVERAKKLKKVSSVMTGK